MGCRQETVFRLRIVWVRIVAQILYLIFWMLITLTLVKMLMIVLIQRLFLKVVGSI